MIGNVKKVNVILQLPIIKKREKTNKEKRKIVINMKGSSIDTSGWQQVKEYIVKGLKFEVILPLKNDNSQHILQTLLLGKNEYFA